MKAIDIQKEGIKVGVISDTHGLLRPEVRQAFAGVDLVLHAGDIGSPEILEELQQLAPVTAVRGNMDYGTWAGHLPESSQVVVGGKRIFMVHDIFGIHFGDAVRDGIHAVISGHTHRPHIERRSGILYLNPGSAGYRRQFYPVSVGLLSIKNNRLAGQLLALAV